jgi:hypothetical protein
MKLYLCRSHDGVYLAGKSLVIANDEAEARALLDAELRVNLLKPDAESGYVLERIPMTKARAVMIWDGDY